MSESQSKESLGLAALPLRVTSLARWRAVSGSRGSRWWRSPSSGFWRVGGLCRFWGGLACLCLIAVLLAILTSGMQQAQADTPLVTIPVGALPHAVVVNPVTNNIYVANSSSSNVTLINPHATQPIPLTVTASPLPNRTTFRLRPTFIFTATSAYSPTTPAVQEIHYAVDTWTTPWLTASPSGTVGSGTAPRLTKGMHTLFAFATDGQEATSINAGHGSTSIPGQIFAYHFLAGGVPITLTSSPNPSAFGQSVTFTATLDTSEGIPTGVITFTDGVTTLGASTLSGGVATLVTSTLSAGSHSIVAEYGGDSAFSSSTSRPLDRIVNMADTTMTLISSPNPSTFGQLVTFTATVTSTAGMPTGVVTFKEGATTLGAGTLSGGVATIAISTLSVGSHSIFARYGGDSNFSGSPSPPRLQTVVFVGTNVWTSHGPEGGSILALAIDPVTPTSLHAGTLGGGVFDIDQAYKLYFPIILTGLTGGW